MTDKIDVWFRDHDPARIMKRQFLDAIRQGKSPKELQVMLETFSHGQLKVSVRTLKRYFKTLPEEIQEQRKANRPKRDWNLPFLRKKRVEEKKPCQHLRFKREFDMAREKIVETCLDCGLELASYDPEEGKKQSRKANQRIYEALAKTRKK